MDRGLRLRATHRRSTRSSHPSRPHTRDERRQLPPQAEPPQTQPTSRPLSHPPPTRLGGERPLPLRSRALSPPKNHPAFISILVPNSSARVVSFHSALDTCAKCCWVLKPQATATSNIRASGARNIILALSSLRRRTN